MSRLTKQMIYQMMIDNASISTPILKIYFKRVLVGLHMKLKIEDSQKKMKRGN